MKLTFWGVRGSIPTPGKHTVRYGGNTPCLEVRLDDDRLIIFDAGTGIRNLGDTLMNAGESVDAHVFISHPHWDHIQGFPFFKPAFIPGNELTIVGTERADKSLSEIMSEQMNRIYFPVQLRDLKAKITFVPVTEEGSMPVHDACVRMMYVNHPGFSLGYRLEYRGVSLVYISDNEPFDGASAVLMNNCEPKVRDKFLQSAGDNPNRRIIDFCRDADVLIHDSTYTPEEYVDRVGWGHSDYLFALGLAAEARVKRLMLFHHDPNHNDEKIDDIVRKCKKEIRTRGYTFECEAAVENAALVLET
jgi:phosphoribosyl 1,2-cyclic phosphodiesterase